jgi:hypothetical protein
VDHRAANPINDDCMMNAERIMFLERGSAATRISMIGSRPDRMPERMT